MVLAYNEEMRLQDSYVATYKIYVLKHPDTDEIFYVGITSKELVDRLRGHMAITNSNNAKVEFIRNIVDEGKKPTIEAVETIDGRSFIDKAYALERELYWMKYYKDLGAKLTNAVGLDSDGTSTTYQGYLSCIKNGETYWRYYVCGKTEDGVDVYDKDRMIADGFKFPEEPVNLPEPESVYYAFKYHKFLIKSGLIESEPQKEENIFSTELFWTEEFKLGMDWDNGRKEDDDVDPEDCDLEIEEDFEPDSDAEPEETDNDDDREYTWQKEWVGIIDSDTKDRLYQIDNILLEFEKFIASHAEEKESLGVETMVEFFKRCK